MPHFLGCAAIAPRRTDTADAPAAQPVELRVESDLGAVIEAPVQ